MAPLVIPMTSCEANCAGSRTAWMNSRTTSATMRATARRELQLEDLMLFIRAPERGFAASPVVMSVLRSGAGAGSTGPALAPSLLQLGDVEDAVELELAALDVLDRELREGRVAVFVEAPRGAFAENALVVFRGEDLLHHRLTVRHAAGLLGGLLDGVEHHVGRLVGVGGVGLDGLVLLLLVVLDELLALPGELALGQAAEGDVDSLRGVARLGEELVHEDAVGSDEGDLVVGHAGADLVLDELGRVILDDAAEVDGVRVGLRDLVHQRAVVGRRAVYPLAADHLYALILRGLLELVGEALAVSLLVVEDVDRLESLIQHQRDAGLALLVVGHDHAGVVELARRVVLLGLGRVGAGLRQADVGVRRADHAEPGLVEDRDLDRRAPGVERPDPADDLLVLRGRLRVLGALGGVPLPGLRRGVVQDLVLDVDVARLVVPLLQGQSNGVDHGRGLGPVCPLHRQVAHDLGGGSLSPTPATATARAAAPDDQQRGGQPQYRQDALPTRSLHFASLSRYDRRSVQRTCAPVPRPPADHP